MVGVVRTRETATTERRSIVAGGVQHAEANTNGERPTGYWWCKSEPTQTERKVLKAHAAPLGLCDNLINALKLVENQQKDGDSPIQSIVTGLHDRSRRGIMDGLRSLSKQTITVLWTWVACSSAMLLQRRLSEKAPTS